MYRRITKSRLTLNTSECFRCWLAGMIDGEGNFYVSNTNKKHPRIRIVLEERDKFVLEYIQQNIGGLLNYRKPQKSWKPHWKPQWEWCIGTYLECTEFTNWIIPYLILKKEKAQIFLEALKW